MSGFRNLTEWVDAYENGQTWSVILRKGVTQSVNDTGTFIDWMYLGGMPSANYYASSPLVAATVDSGVRPYLPSVAPAKQYIKTLDTLLQGINSTTFTGSNSLWILLDYLLYYPFVDFTAVGEVQVMDNTTPLPRYTDGKGVQMMMVCQSGVVGSGQMSVTYINQDGVQKTTPTFWIRGTSFAGCLCNANNSTTTAQQPFIPLAIGDSGVRSVVSVTVSEDGGGIAAIVLVKPLYRDANAESSFRSTSSPVTSYGTPTRVEFALEKQPVEIKDGAHLGFIGLPSTGDTRYTYLTARIETVWN